MCDTKHNNNIFVPERFSEEFRLRLQRYENALSKSDSDIARKFYGFLIKWYKYMFNPKVMASSNPMACMDSDPYRGIIQLGKPALPLIIDNMRKGDIFLWHAVKDITGVDLVDKNELLSEQKIARLYLNWWDTEGRDKFINNK